MPRILLTGATGFVGRRLATALTEAGHEDLRAMTRRPDAYDGPGVAVAGDVSNPGSLAAAMAGVDIAYYLVHSLDDSDFERKDAEAARNFSSAAAGAGVRQIIYLGGLGDDGALSAHLRSRREVEDLLAGDGVPVTVLRAAVVVGNGGISWEITRQLVKSLPAMIVPKWATTRTQPIALDDVVRYLVGVADVPEAFGRVFEIGGPDQLSYLEMLRIASRVEKGREVPIMTVPVLTPQLSSYWLALVTDVDVTTGRNLIDSMGTEVVVREHSIREIVPGEPIGYEESVRRALAERNRQAV